MTERTVRMLAKEFAGKFYEETQRSLRFRRTWPNQDQYVAQNWPHFVDISVQALGAMLHQPGVPEHRKQAIYQALIDQNEREARSPNALTPIQAVFDYDDKAEKRSLDENLHLPGVRG
jgi:hypothetical protein